MGLGTAEQFGGGGPAVVRPLAAFLRAYQLDGGDTPGPLLFLAAGRAGRLGVPAPPARNMPTADRDAARACCYLLASGVTLLLLSDTFEFSWRYQLPALVTLPPAGALGITVIIGYVRSLRGPRSAEAGAPWPGSGPLGTPAKEHRRPADGATRWTAPHAPAVNA